MIALLAGPAAAGCQLALALALDVSSSVDGREYRLQRDGLAVALMSADVQSALFSGSGDVAIAVYEWSGRNQQVLVLDWTLLTSPQVLAGVVRRISESQRTYDEFPTALGYALGYGAVLLARAPRCDRQTIDVSGDGITNDGFAPEAAYRSFPFQGVTVNGLVLAVDYTISAYYRAQVIRGPAAFVEIARGYRNFEAAMKRKLLREIGHLAIGGGPDRAAPGNG